MTAATAVANKKQPNGQTPRTISDPNQVAQLVMMRIDQVNSS